MEVKYNSAAVYRKRHHWSPLSLSLRNVPAAPFFFSFFFPRQFLAVVFFGAPLCSFAVADTTLWFDIDWNGGSQVEALEELEVSFQFCDRNDSSRRLRNGGLSFALRTEQNLITCEFQRQRGAQPNKCRACTIWFCAFLRGEWKQKKNTTQKPEGCVMLLLLPVGVAVTVKRSYL